MTFMTFRRLAGLAFALLFAFGFLAVEASAKKVEIIISKVSQKMTVKVDGDTEYVWPVSTGAAQYETPSGNFRPFRMEAEHFSKEWDDAPMPHSIFFTGDGHAIHGSYHVKSLGRRASHGCVRLSPDNAATLFELVGDAGMSNTRVVLKGGFFDFSGGSRSFSEVGNDIDKTIKKKRPVSGFWASFGRPSPKVKAKQKVVAKVAKPLDKKPKKVASLAPKKLSPDAPAKTDLKAKKVAAKCVDKDGKKNCVKAPVKAPALKAAANS
jgi:hypothetical protein